jgi:transcription-repair coupling factor (superfamily II helicase)
VLDGLAEGTVDIVVGTHKLLQPSSSSNRPGLAIIDEEHRFGVRHKEQLKNLRAEVDVLTLTATPIPRTLNMAMSGMRDLSIIATPPVERHPIKTFVSPGTTA